MKGKVVTALVAKKSIVKKHGLQLEHFYRISAALGHKLYLGETKCDIIVYCLDNAANRRLMTFGALATEFREQKVDLNLTEVKPIEIKPDFKPVIA